VFVFEDRFKRVDLRRKRDENEVVWIKRKMVRNEKK